jgi:hypothetical protein
LVLGLEVEEGGVATNGRVASMGVVLAVVVWDSSVWGGNVAFFCWEMMLDNNAKVA